MSSGYDQYGASFSAPKVSQFTHKFVWPVIGASPGTSPSTFVVENRPIEPSPSNIFFNPEVPASTYKHLTFATIVEEKEASPYLESFQINQKRYQTWATKSCTVKPTNSLVFHEELLKGAANPKAESPLPFQKIPPPPGLQAKKHWADFSPDSEFTPTPGRLQDLVASLQQTQQSQFQLKNPPKKIKEVKLMPPPKRAKEELAQARVQAQAQTKTQVQVQVQAPTNVQAQAPTKPQVQVQAPAKACAKIPTNEIPIPEEDPPKKEETTKKSIKKREDRGTFDDESIEDLRYTGSLKFYQMKKRFGFITLDKETPEDVFLCEDDLILSGVNHKLFKEKLINKIDMKFDFNVKRYIEKGREKKKAINIRIIE